MLSRRQVIGSALAPVVARPGPGFFRVAEAAGRWWFLTPQGEPFFSIGMNHIDSAALRYPENVHLWRERFGNSERKWLEEKVARDLRDWGFNTVGWVQEVVVRTPSIHRHSRNFGFEQYQWIGMPYCHMLPFADFHQWEVETRHPDLFSRDFEEWCDYVARDSCQRMAGDPKLIGYFYIDCPTWVHTRAPERKGPLFDPKKLASAAGRAELHALATRYYRVTHDAVRRYDRNHLILGDRYEAKAPLPDEVLLAAKPYVDVMSFQYFGEPEDVARDFRRWHQLTGKPVLLADASAGNRQTPPAERGRNYARMMRSLRELPCCVGWHVCGAYLKNRVRGFGFLDENGNPAEDLVAQARQANREAARLGPPPAVP